MAVPNSFATATSAIPLANLDANFAYYDAAYQIASGVMEVNYTFRLEDPTDNTKKAQFVLSSIATATTRQYTLQNQDGTIAFINATQTFSGVSTFSASTNTFGSATVTSTYGLGSGATISTATKTINIGTGGVSGSTTNIAIGSAVSGALGTTTLNSNVVQTKLYATSSAAPTIASAATIAPTTQILFVSGTTAISTITAPSPISVGGGTITIIPTGVFTTTTTGNIALASIAVVNRALMMTYDVTTTKWYPSY